MQKNRDQFLSYQKRYRETHKKEIYERGKRSRLKKPEYYKQLHLEHYKKRHGLPDDYVPRYKSKNGEGNVSKQGYRRITHPNHPNAQSSGIILEHILVMSEHLNRPIQKGETVHHINGDRLDNRIENLELWSRSHPPGQRISDKIDWCIEFLNKYLDDEIFRGQIINWVKSKR